MKWSDLNIWENFKNFFESLTKKKNYTLVIFVSLLYAILIFTLYPFINIKDINNVLSDYLYILFGILSILLILFFYICGQFNFKIESSKELYPAMVTIETVIIVGIALYLIYNNLGTDFKQKSWNIINIFVVIGFIIQFIYLFWTCYDKPCDKKDFFGYLIGWTVVLSLFILIAGLFYRNDFNKAIGSNQSIIYAILILFVFIMLLSQSSSIFNQSQSITSNSILETLVKYIFIIIVIILTQVFYKNLQNYLSLIFSILVIVNLLPFIFNIPHSWMQLFIFYPICFIVIFTGVFYLTGLANFIGLQHFNTFLNLGYETIMNTQSIWLKIIGLIFGSGLIIPIFFMKFIGYQLNIPDLKNTKPSHYTFLFQAINFVFVFGFIIFLLFVALKDTNEAVKLAEKDAENASKTAEETAKTNGATDENAKKAGENASDDIKKSAAASGYNDFINSLNSWWLWVGFIFVYIILTVISGLVSNGIQKESQLFSIICIVLFTICYFIILYYEFFNFNRTSWFDQKNIDKDLSIYAKNISVILIVGVLLYSLSKYAKINNSFIIIFILLSVIFIYNKLQGFLYTKLWQHASRTNCNIDKGGGISIAVIFLFISLVAAFYLSPTTTNPIYIFIAVLISIFGYYLGEYITSPSKANKDKTYCNTFISTPPLSDIDSIKIIVFISVIILLFVAMNFFTQKLKNAKNSLYQLFIIGVSIFLFWSYIIIIGEGLPNITKISALLFNKEYYTPNFKNRWCDFLIVITTFIIFMSGIGLIITISSNQIFSGFFNALSMIITGYTINAILENFSKTSFATVLEIPNHPFQVSLKKTFVLFLMLIYKFFESFIIIPLKLNSIYDRIGNYVEQNFLTGAFVILAIEFIIVGIYLLCRTIYRWIKSTFFDENANRFMLIKTPTYIFPSSETKYEELPKEQPYTFGLSFSLFIEEVGDANYFIPILSYNNNPCIMYKPSANNLVVTIPTGSATINKPVTGDNKHATAVINSYTILNSHIGSEVDDKYIVYSTTDVKLQTWINIFINYNSGVIDTFLDGNLVNSSKINQLQIDQYTNSITLGFGDDEDTYIKINNLDYYNKDIGADNILRINMKNHFTE